MGFNEKVFPPFEPKGHLFESEFLLPAPRPIPENLYRGEYATMRRRLHWGLLWGGAACLALSTFQAVRDLGAYFVPMAYLHWVGLGLIILMLGSIILFRFGGSFRYVRKGVPITVRILDISAGTYRDGTLGYTCMIECLPPGETETIALFCSSPGRNYSESHFDQLNIKPGQYVTGVYLPGQFPKSLRLYGFLGISPEVAFVSKSPKVLFRKNPVLQWLIVMTFVAGFAGVCTLWYVLGHCEPLHWGWNLILPGIVGGLVFGAWYAILSVWETREDIRRLALDEAAAAGEHNGPRGQKPLWLDASLKAWGFKIALSLASLAFGAAITLSALCLANARLDRSQPRHYPVVIRRLLVTTTNSILKTYSIEYSWPGSDKKQTFPASLDHIRKFHTDVGLAEVHEGRFGWPWLARIHPGVIGSDGRVHLEN